MTCSHERFWARRYGGGALAPTACSPPGSSVHGIFQARILEWASISFSKMLYIILFKDIIVFIYLMVLLNIIIIYLTISGAWFAPGLMC